MSHLIACPDCNKHLQVPEGLLGKKVQCPECKHAFTAALPETEIASKPAEAPSPSKPPAWEEKAPSGRDDREFDDDDRDVRRRRRDDDDDDFDDAPRRRMRSRMAPHRGGMILAFGIIGLVGSGLGIPIILGVLAWFMGNNDLREMREGRMDPEGETMTNVGRILGMITTILTIAGILLTCTLFCLFFGVAGFAVNKG